MRENYHLDDGTNSASQIIILMVQHVLTLDPKPGLQACSGHGAMRENYYLDDGTYSASQIIILMVQRALEGRGKDVAADLLAQLPEPAEAREFRLKLKARCPRP